MLEEAPGVGSDNSNTRIGQVVRQEPAPGGEDQRVEFHVGDLRDAVTQDFPRGAGDPARDQQDLARVRALAHRVVDRLLDLVHVLG